MDAVAEQRGLALKLSFTLCLFLIVAMAGSGRNTGVTGPRTVIGKLKNQRSYSEESVGVNHTCDFDNGFCGWTQDSSDVFDWVQNSGSTLTMNTGPSCDPSNCATGKYIYTESSLPRLPGERARIISPKFQGGSPKCLSFYYNMYGENMGTLNIYSTISSNRHLLWTLNGDQGASWYRAEVTFNPQYSYQIIIEGIRGSGYRSDMAVDDVVIKPGPCAGSPSFSCDFEKDMCGWTQDGGDKFDWTRHRGLTATPGTGPLGDHTSGGGYYLYTETSVPRIRGDIARVYSPFTSAANNQCLMFWYHMYGTHVAALRVKKQHVEGNNETILWQLTGDQGDHWLQGNINISQSGSDYRIVIEGEVGDSYRGDIAIDDIILRGGFC